MTFETWLKQTSNLSDSSIYKYSHAVNSISTDMMNESIIAKPIREMELFEVDLAIAVIFITPSFKQKNSTGNNMYSSALKWYRCYVESVVKTDSVEKDEVERILKNDKLTVTERETLVKSRIGQGDFRERLLDKYSKCIITEIDIPQCLIASHIKPWAVCSNSERVDVNNGLLLSATYDRLFDSGLISFDCSGQVLLSQYISNENLSRLSLKKNQRFNIKFVSEMKPFLDYHNDVIFIK